MKADFWHERWRQGQIGFHQRLVSTQLQRFWPTLNLVEGSAVFVPLCGKSLDMLWLREQRHEVVGIELSEVAVEAFCMENGVPAARMRRGGLEEYRAAHLQLFCGDFFDLTQETLGSFAAIYDRAALVSWAPELRVRYVEQLAALTPKGCQTLLIAFEYPENEMSGPPFSVDAECVHRLYSAHHEIRQLHREDVLASEPNLRARGATQLYESCYRLTRL